MKIFISHSSKNKYFGNALVELLRNIGIKENEIIFTSNVVYGIPIGKNIFNWLKSQITEKPFVIYLLSDEYYKSIACLNEMGAAWIIENEHAAIFTPNFNLSSNEFQSGVLDPREIGFYINDKEKLSSFIQSLPVNFKKSNNIVSLNQSINKFIEKIEQINQNEIKESLDNHKEIKTIKLEKTNKEETIKENEDIYTKFIRTITSEGLSTDELLLLHYIKETGRVKLNIESQVNVEIFLIKEWEKKNGIKENLSQNYENALNKFRLRGFLDESNNFSSFYYTEINLKKEISKNILELPYKVLEIIDREAWRNSL